MPMRIINTIEKGPRTVVTLVLTEPIERRDDRLVEVVNTTDRFHRNVRELMKNLNYRWVGGNFSGEVWFLPVDSKMFENGPRIVVVTYKTIVEDVQDLSRNTPEYTALVEAAHTRIHTTLALPEGESYDAEIP